MPAAVGTDEERIMLGRWIQKGQGLIVGGSPLGVLIWILILSALRILKKNLRIRQV